VVTAGLPVAVELLKDIADKYDGVSYADLFQMASAQAIEVGLLQLYINIQMLALICIRSLHGCQQTCATASA